MCTAAAAAGPSSSEGVRFVYERPGQVLKLRFGRGGSSSASAGKLAKPTDVKPEVDVMVEGHTGLSKCVLARQRGQHIGLCH